VTIAVCVFVTLSTLVLVFTTLVLTGLPAIVVVTGCVSVYQIHISQFSRIPDQTYDCDSGKLGGRDRSRGGPYGYEGALRGGCAGSGVGSRGEGQGRDSCFSLDNLRGLWRLVVLALVWSLFRRSLLRRSLLWGRLLWRSLLRRKSDTGDLERGVWLSVGGRWSDPRRWGAVSAKGDRDSGRSHRGGDIVYSDSLGPGLALLEIVDLRAMSASVRNETKRRSGGEKCAPRFHQREWIHKRQGLQQQQHK